MNLLATSFASLACLLATSCGLSTVKDTGAPPLDSVLTGLKEQLAYAQRIRPEIVPSESTCYSTESPIAVTPVLATVTLNTALKNVATGSVSAVNPIAVISLDPKISSTFTKGQSQKVNLSLNVGAFKKQVTPDIDLKNADRAKYPIAVAIAGVRDALLKTNHSIEPCLGAGSKPENNAVKLTLAFDAIQEQQNQVTFNLVFLKLGGGNTRTVEGHQTMEIAFAVTGTALQ